ncbi:hypothetical protein BDV98DRAFT_554653 [Pterulicium gracile]|uniref:LIM zinc-binding domain-containing protein n=1 Tax=Pterulicium gracile TaxID=1884261 RepID=A0A5C3Q9L0_9AGAR|nr:hypothetical protein BDV98DRAFT_554653 [Pterula gracilis]
MHPFGINPVCGRCSKAVYAAEQVMGPGRKLYHKSCMKCTSCNKRLDSHSLVEHDEEPYCKNCHVKNFGTRDLRYANLPQAPARPDSPQASTPPPPSEVIHEESETSTTFQDPRPSSPAPLPSPTKIVPTRTLPTLSNRSFVSPMRQTITGDTPTRPLSQTPTGTRYGNVLGNGGVTTTHKKWGSVNPVCPRCHKSVYFAEQVKAIGKAWHKNCLRCAACGTTLASGQVTDKDDEPYCSKCYGKLHGPRGGGYALLGKAGG